MAPQPNPRARDQAAGHGQFAAAQGRRALHPRQGHLRRRHQAAGHAVRRDGAQPLCACAHQIDRQDEGAGRARRRRGADRRRPEAGQAALDAHARRRRPGGARGREGLLPDAGSGDGDRQRPLRAADGAARWRSTTRSCRRSSTRTSRWRRTRRSSAKTSPARTRSGTASARIPTTSSPGRRATRTPPTRFRERRGHGPRRDPESARASVPAGDLRLRRLVRQGHRPAHGLHDLAGAAPRAHRGRDALRHPREQDPHRRRRHRRRLRQQGAGVSGLCGRDRRVDRHRRADQVDRVAHRQHLDHRLRPRLPRRRRAGGRQGRPHQGLCASPRWPITARSTRTSRPPSCRPACSASAPALTTSPRPTAGSTRSTPTRRPAAWPTAVRCGSPRRCT